jgi:L-ascorbate metabolism protein UlaG (beta-lactamase superfamily)
MKITKLGHCCMLIEHNGKRILTDPGNYSVSALLDLTGLDLIFITHEHGDHLHLESLKHLLQINPDVQIWTNSAVSRLLKAEKIESQLIADKQKKILAGIEFLIVGKLHATVYKTLPTVENTGFIIDGILFYPGDALTPTKEKFTALALPVAGPWLKLGEAIDYALSLTPKTCFPVHDGMLNSFGTSHALPEKILGQNGIKFNPLGPGDSSIIKPA